MASRICKARNSRGDPCRGTPLREADFCVFHDPDHTETVQQARSAGGQRRKREAAIATAYDFEGLTSIEKIRRLIDIAVVDALSLDNSISRARASRLPCPGRYQPTGEGRVRGPSESLRERHRPTHEQHHQETLVMTLPARLQRLTKQLTPHERAVLVLQALREGREPDPELRRIDDEVQRRAFNRYMALLWVANQELGAVAAITSYRVEVAEQAANHWDLFNQAAGLIEEEHDMKPAKPSRNWRTKPEVTVPEFLRGLALECRDEAVQHIEHLWKETLSLEALWAGLGEEFAGEDVVLPETHERHVQTQERLQTLARQVGLKRLPGEPEEDMLQAFQKAVDDSFRHLGYAEA